MLTALGIVAFVVALLVSVMLHEGGHFVTARRYGMKATQFFVGFGPTLWSFRRGETEYGVKAVPAGGFVKIVGMTPLEEVDPEDEPRAFWRQKPSRKAVVLAAGSTVHFILATVLLLGTSLVLGKAVETPRLNAITDCVTVAVGGDCSGTDALPSPAQQAGLQAGDLVQAVDGQPVDNLTEFVTAVRGVTDRPVVLTVDRGGVQQDIAVQPVAVPRPSLEDENRIEQVGTIGVSLQGLRGTERLGPLEAVDHSIETAGLMATGIYTTFTEKLGTITDVYGPNRDPEGFIGVVGASRISGEVLASEETLAFKIIGFMLLIASLNFFIGVFNLLPLLPLDGGHLAVLGFETVRDKARRLRGYRGEVQRVDFTKLLPLTYAVVLLFAGFTLFLLGADIVNPITLN